MPLSMPRKRKPEASIEAPILRKSSGGFPNLGYRNQLYWSHTKGVVSSSQVFQTKGKGPGMVL